MPRTARPTTQRGAPAQPISATPGQVYGAGVEQMAMQRVMPAPNMQSPAAAIPQGASSAPAAAGPVDPARVMALAAGLKEQTGLLTAPTQRPNEPITAGLSRGPGPGPEILAAPSGSPSGDILRRLSQSTGDPQWAELARKAQM